MICAFLSTHAQLLTVKTANLMPLDARESATGSWLASMSALRLLVCNVSIPSDLYEIVVKKDLEQADCLHLKKIYESIEIMISAYNKRDIDLLKEGLIKSVGNPCLRMKCLV